ncbi:MAG: DUF3343 domain-containing protein [Anaerovoracaceae bacterium]
MNYYILFKNHTDSMAMYTTLKKEGFKVRISPTPRELSVCCGVSLLALESEIDAIKAYLADNPLDYLSIEPLNNTFDNTRHRYG